MLSRACVAAPALLLLAGCGGSLQGPPNFVQVYSVVDQPCAPADGAAPCTAHVLVVNRGGEGVGHATVLVPMKDAAASSARTISTARCGQSIPDTAPGGYVDLTCAFTLPAGKSVATYPSLDVDFSTSVTGSGSAAGNLGGIATFGLAVIAAIVAVVTFVIVLMGRRRAAGLLARVSEPQPDTEEDGGAW
jgi:hypothetical protein